MTGVRNARLRERRPWERRLCGMVLFVTAACMSATALAQVYRWVDDEGRVHYSDTPPNDVKAERLPIESQPTDLEAAMRRTVEQERALELKQQERADEAEQAAAEAAHAADLERACAEARARVARIESARRLSRVDEDGTRHTYTDDERAAALAEARRNVTEWCR